MWSLFDNVSDNVLRVAFIIVIVWIVVALFSKDPEDMINWGLMWLWIALIGLVIFNLLV